MYYPMVKQPYNSPALEGYIKFQKSLKMAATYGVYMASSNIAM